MHASHFTGGVSYLQNMNRTPGKLNPNQIIPVSIGHSKIYHSRLPSLDRQFLVGGLILSKANQSGVPLWKQCSDFVFRLASYTDTGYFRGGRCEAGRDLLGLGLFHRKGIRKVVPVELTHKVCSGNRAFCLYLCLVFSYFSFLECGEPVAFQFLCQVALLVFGWYVCRLWILMCRPISSCWRLFY